MPPLLRRIENIAQRIADQVEGERERQDRRTSQGADVK